METLKPIEVPVITDYGQIIDTIYSRMHEGDLTPQEIDLSDVIQQIRNDWEKIEHLREEMKKKRVDYETFEGFHLVVHEKWDRYANENGGRDLTRPIVLWHFDVMIDQSPSIRTHFYADANGRLYSIQMEKDIYSTIAGKKMTETMRAGIAFYADRTEVHSSRNVGLHGKFTSHKDIVAEPPKHMTHPSFI